MKEEREKEKERGKKKKGKKSQKERESQKEKEKEKEEGENEDTFIKEHEEDYKSNDIEITELNMPRNKIDRKMALYRKLSEEEENTDALKRRKSEY